MVSKLNPDETDGKIQPGMSLTVKDASFFDMMVRGRWVDATLVTTLEGKKYYTTSKSLYEFFVKNWKILDGKTVKIEKETNEYNGKSYTKFVAEIE